MDNSQETKSSISKRDALVLGAAVFIIVIASYLLLNTFKTPAKEVMEAPSPNSTESVATEEAAPAPTPVPEEIKTFNVSADNFSFSLSEIRVKKGDKVKIIFKNDEGFHDWVVDEFAARTPKLKAGESAEAEFVADKPGAFEYYCSVGSHRAMGMKGNLVVEE